MRPRWWTKKNEGTKWHDFPFVKPKLPSVLPLFYSSEQIYPLLFIDLSLMHYCATYFKGNRIIRIQAMIKISHKLFLYTFNKNYGLWRSVTIVPDLTIQSDSTTSRSSGLLKLMDRLWTSCSVKLKLNKTIVSGRLVLNLKVSINSWSPKSTHRCKHELVWIMAGG